jgi:hypothetical protein
MTTTFRTLIAAAAALGAATLSTQAGAVSLGVKMACASDYYAYCSHHAVGSPGLRQCMRANGPKLSSRCINALVAAGEVSKSVVEKKLAAK